MLERVRGVAESLAGKGAGAARAVWSTGVLAPVRPDRALRMPVQYWRYGPTPAAVGAMAALRWPRRTAVIDERGEVTYEELERQSAALACGLLQHLAKAGADARVGILCRNHRGFVQAVLAASRLGHDVVLLNTDFSGKQLGAVLERERVAVLIHDGEFRQAIEQSRFPGPCVRAWNANGPARGRGTMESLIAANPPLTRRPDRPSRVIIMTSGTTGTPKGAQHDMSLSSLVPVAMTHAIRVPLRSGEPIVVAPPLFHVLGLAYMSAGLALGTPMVVLRRFEPKAVLDQIASHRAQGLIAVPVMLQRILDVPERPDTGSLRAVVCGGAPLRPQLSEAFMDAFGEVLINVYGATETGWATIATAADLRAAPGTVGRPSLGLTLRVLDESGDPLPPGETGEIYTGGGLRFAGYTSGESKREREGLTSTGDLGHYDEEGRLFIDGRADDMIVSGGENVFPGEVEELLGGHPGVAEAAVTGVDDDQFGQRLAAYIVRSPGSRVTAERLKSYVKDHLARYKVPRDIHFVNELPRTSTGKVKARALPN